MATLSKEQRDLMLALGLPAELDGLGDDELIHIEDVLADELQLHGIDPTGTALNAHGELCRACILALPD